MATNVLHSQTTSTINLLALLYLSHKHGRRTTDEKQPLSHTKWAIASSSAVVVVTMLSMDAVSLLLSIADDSTHKPPPDVYAELEDLFPRAHRTVNSFLAVAMCFSAAHFADSSKDSSMWVMGTSAPNSKYAVWWKGLGFTVLIAEVLVCVLPTHGWLGHVPGSLDFGIPSFAVTTAAVGLAASTQLWSVMSGVGKFVRQIRESHPSEISVAAMEAIRHHHHNNQSGTSSSFSKTKTTVDFLADVEGLASIQGSGMALVAASVLSAVCAIALNVGASQYDQLTSGMFCVSTMISALLLICAAFRQKESSILRDTINSTIDYNPTQVHSFLTGAPPVRTRSPSMATSRGRGRPNSIVLVDPVLESTSLLSSNRNAMVYGNTHVPSPAEFPDIEESDEESDAPTTANLIGTEESNESSCSASVRSNATTIAEDSENVSTDNKNKRHSKLGRINLSSLLPKLAVPPAIIDNTDKLVATAVVSAHEQVFSPAQLHSTVAAAPPLPLPQQSEGARALLVRPRHHSINLTPDSSQGQYVDSVDVPPIAPRRGGPGFGINALPSPAETPRTFDHQSFAREGTNHDHVSITVRTVGVTNRATPNRNRMRSTRTLSAVIGTFHGEQPEAVLPLYDSAPREQQHQVGNEALAQERSPAVSRNFNNADLLRPRTPSDFPPRPLIGRVQGRDEGEDNDNSDDKHDPKSKVPRGTAAPTLLLSPPATPTLASDRFDDDHKPIQHQDVDFMTKLRLSSEEEVQMTASGAPPDPGKPSEVMSTYRIPRNVTSSDVMPNDESTPMTFPGMPKRALPKQSRVPRGGSKRASLVVTKRDPTHFSPPYASNFGTSSMTMTITGHPSDEPDPAKPSLNRLQYGDESGFVGTLRLRGEASSTVTSSERASESASTDEQLRRAFSIIPAELVSRIISYVDPSVSVEIGEPRTKVASRSIESQTVATTHNKVDIALSVHRYFAGIRNSKQSRLLPLQTLSDSAKGLVSITLSRPSTIKTILRNMLDKSITNLTSQYPKGIRPVVKDGLGTRKQQLRQALDSVLNSKREDPSSSGKIHLVIKSPSASVDMDKLNAAIDKVIELNKRPRFTFLTNPKGLPSSVAKSKPTPVDAYTAPLAKQMVAASVYRMARICARSNRSAKQQSNARILAATVPLRRHLAETLSRFSSSRNSGGWVKATVSLERLPSGDYAVKWLVCPGSTSPASSEVTRSYSQGSDSSEPSLVSDSDTGIDSPATPSPNQTTFHHPSIYSSPTSVFRSSPLFLHRHYHHQRSGSTGTEGNANSKNGRRDTNNNNNNENENNETRPRRNNDFYE